jgi:hypothetical protein
MKAHRKEETERQHRAADGRDPGPKSEERTQTNEYFGPRNRESNRSRDAHQVRQQSVQRAKSSRRQHLGVYATRALRVEKRRVRQLLKAREEKGDTQENAKRQQRPLRKYPRTNRGVQWQPIFAVAGASITRGVGH